MTDERSYDICNSSASGSVMFIALMQVDNLNLNLTAHTHRVLVWEDSSYHLDIVGGRSAGFSWETYPITCLKEKHIGSTIYDAYQDPACFLFKNIDDNQIKKTISFCV